MAYTLLRTDVGTTSSWGYTNSDSIYEFKVEVWVEQSVTGNYSKLLFKPYMRSKGAYRTYSSGWKIAFNQDTPNYYRMFTHDLTAGSSIMMGSPSEVTIYHDTNGVANYSYYCHFWNDTNGGVGVLRSGNVGTSSSKISFNLPTINRQANITRVSTFTMSTPGVIEFDKIISGFTYKMYAYFGSTSQTISTNVTSTTVSFTPPKAWATQIPNATVGVGTILLQTYSGSTLIGESRSGFECHIWNASDAYPTFTSLRLTGVNLWNGYYVKGVSQVTASITGVTEAYSSTVKTYNLNGHGLDALTSSATSGILTQTGNLTYTGKITDSRGRSYTKTNSIVVEDYWKPTISNVSVVRCDSVGNPNAEGNHVTVSFKSDICNIASANKNAKLVTIKSKVKGSYSTTTLVSGATLTEYSYQYISNALSGFDITKSYEISITLSDSFNSITSTTSISSASCVLNVEEKGIGIGKYHEKGALDVKGEIYIDGGKVPTIATDGVMEVGQYIDMYHGNFNNDYDVRFEVTNTRYLEIRPAGKWATVYGGLTVDDGNGNRIDLIARTDGTSMGNTACSKYLRIANNGWLHYNGDVAINRLGIADTRGSNPAPNNWSSYQMSLDFKTASDLGINNGSATWFNVLTTKGWSSDAADHPVSQLAFNGDALYYQSSNGGNGWRGWCRIPMLHYVHGYWGLGIANNDTTSWLRTPTSGFIPYEPGGNSSSLGTQSWMFKEIHGKTLYMANSRCFWASSTTDIMTNSSILPDSNSGNPKCLGYTNNKWAVVYANNGTIQTSDMRYKSDIQEVDNEIFFEMIKGTGVHTYVLNDERVDLPKAQPLTLENAPQEQIHLGILAQELAEFEGHEFILNYDDESGYSVNNYNLTSAVMSALKVEISRREEAEKRIEELESRLARIEELLFKGE